MTGGFAVKYRGVAGTLHKTVFEPQADGSHIRIEYRKFAGNWTPVGREPVEDVEVETPPGGTNSQPGP